MSNSALRVGVGTRVVYDGKLLEVAELHAGPSGTEAVLRSCRGQGGIVRVTLQELLTSRRASLIADTAGVAADDAEDPADVVLSAISETERAIVAERAAHGVDVVPDQLDDSAHRIALMGESRDEIIACLEYQLGHEMTVGAWGDNRARPRS